jgi:hypothetical protein
VAVVAAVAVGPFVMMMKSTSTPLAVLVVLVLVQILLEVVLRARM